MGIGLRVLSLIPALVFMVSCATGPTASTPSSDTIRIGVYLPMTGAKAQYGKLEWEGIKTANEMKPSVYGKRIDLVLVDTESDKSQAERAVRRLVEKEKVSCIVGEAISTNTMAGNAVSEAAGIPSVSPTSTNPLVTQGKKYAFRIAAVDPFQGTVAARFAAEQLEAKSAAVLIDTAQDYSVGMGNYFVREFVENGKGKISATLYFQSGDKDYSSQLTTLRTLNPDLIYAPAYHREIVLLAKQARSMGIHVPILSGDGVATEQLIEDGGTAVENLYFTDHFDKEALLTDRARQFTRVFGQNHREEVSGFAALGADAYFLLVEAIQLAGSTDGAKIRETLAATKDFRGVTGVIDRIENGNPIKSMNIMTVSQGRFKYVTVVSPASKK